MGFWGGFSGVPTKNLAFLSKITLLNPKNIKNYLFFPLLFKKSLKLQFFIIKKSIS
jgi:hypothetical protein